MINDTDFYHGALFRRLAISGQLTVAPLPGRSLCNYLVNSNIALHIKHSTKRLAPWRFTFSKEQQDEIEALRQSVGKTVVALVCGSDGFVVLTYEELKQVLDEHHGDAEWVSVKRGRREMYEVQGSNGKLSYKIGKNDGVSKLLTQSSGTETQLENESTVSVVMRRASALLESLGTGK